MPGLRSWLPGQPASAPVPGSTAQVPVPYYPRLRDPNAPDYRLQLASKCIYERQLPGGSYITAHVERLQSGYYDSPEIHEDCINSVRFVAIRFVMHEANTERRFKSAIIRISLRDEALMHDNIVPLPPQLEHPVNDDTPQQPVRQKPKFLRHAPHLLYGAMSPETLDWNFNLAGSIGVAQTPVSASINPSYGMKSSYKLYKMMKIQGSIRTTPSWYGKNNEIEDGEIVWTMEENSLQRSGLPREFTFVMMLTKGDDRNDVTFNVEIEPEVASWFGTYPQWWTHFLKYQPLYKEPLNLDKEVGQKFEPSPSPLGFNFAGLMSTFDDFVNLPGTLYANHEFSANAGTAPSATQQAADQQKQKPQSKNASDGSDPPNPNNTLHLRIHLDHPDRQARSLSADIPKPGLAQKLQQASPVRATSSPKPSPKPSPKSEQRSRSDPNRSTKLSRRFTLNGGLTSTPPKHKYSRVTPLQTHYEESPLVVTESKPRSSSEAEAEAEADHDYEFSFPEPLSTPSKLPSQNVPASSTHRHSKSVSTTSSSATGHKTSSAPVSGSGATAPVSSPGPAAPTAPLTSHHSLRRNRSRSDLRRASLISTPEDEEAITAAMDMMSGSPPPPAPAAPRSAPTAVIASEDTVLATPRTRATLADLLEVERAENARVARRNGTLATQSRDMGQEQGVPRSHEPIHITSRSRDREQNREKRFSLPVTSTGIGYPSTGGSFSDRHKISNSGPGNPNGVARSSEAGKAMGNGRSSLMIPIGIRQGTGLGIGIASSTSDNVANVAGRRSTSLRRNGDSRNNSEYESA